MARTSTFYSTAFVSTLTALIVACGGGGNAEESPSDMPEAVQYEPLQDMLIQVPDGYASDAPFMVLMRGNLVEAS